MRLATYSVLVKILFVFGIVSVLFLLSSEEMFAKVGVGMGAGEIRVTESIKPGGIYSLPSLRVFNTGDETTTYGMNIAYHQDNPQLRPGKSWFSFTPATFTIEPGESQEVQISMSVPVKTDPGEYFAFLESGPVAEGGPGTSVGVAVATKLYFDVVHANLWSALTYRVSTFLTIYAPWSWIGLGLLVCGAVAFIFARFFSLDVSLRKKKTQE
ncbi:hypothetical protein IPH92_00520 [Candidatus Kaiserbacteria bacterium]|nr:MAG: hypothetical protein IPH92_00520 [Candidatus Kaiserbacteria bacterium]